jgi:hypothetical protein
MTQPQDPDSAARRVSADAQANWQALKDGVAKRNAAAHAVARKKRDAADLAKRRARAIDDH